MAEIVNMALAAVGTLVLLGLGYLVYTKWISPPDHRDAAEETQEQIALDDADVSRSERVGMFARTRRQPGTTKAFYAALVLLGGVLVVAGYSVLQSGTPSEMKYADQIGLFVFGCITVGGGVWFARKQDRKAGRLRVVQEGEGASVLEIPFDWNAAAPAAADNEGKDAVLVPAYKKSRIVGLFWRVALVGDDPEVRDLDKSHPEDRVLYEVPMDESAAWDYREQTVTVRAKGRTPDKNPNKLSTYRFIPSDRASKGELEDMRDTVEELKSEIDHLERMAGIKDEEIESLEEKLKNVEHGSDQKYEEAMQNVLRIAGVLNNNPNAAGADAAGVSGNGNGKGANAALLNGQSDNGAE